MRKSGSFMHIDGRLTLVHRTGLVEEVPAAKFPTPAMSGAIKKRRQVPPQERPGIQTTDQRS